MPKRVSVRPAMQRLLEVLAVLCLSVIVGVSPGWAQQETPGSGTETPRPEPPQEPSPPKLIPAPEITERARDATRRSKEIAEHLEPDPAVLKFMDQLRDAEQDVLGLRAEIEGRDLDSLSRIYLEDLQRELARLRSTLESRQKTLRQRGAELDGWREELNEIREPWKATREAPSFRELPEVSRHRVVSVIDSIDQTRVALNTRLEEVLELEDQGLRQSETVADDLRAVESALNRARGRLFARQSAPLWQAVLAPADTPFPSRVASVWNKNASDLARFFDDYRPQLYWHLFIFLVLLVVAVDIRHSTKHSDDDDDVEVRSAAHILSRPVSSSFLIALILVPWLYPDAPRVVHQLTLTLMLVPLLRILPGLVYPSMRLPLFELGVLYLLVRIADFSVHEPVVRRLISVVVGVVGGVGLAWLARPGGAATSVEGGRLWRVAILLVRLAAVLLAISAVANILGHDLLSDLILRATVNSLFLGVVLFAAYLVLAGSVTALLRGRLAQASRAIRNNPALVKRRCLAIIGVAGVLTWVWLALSLFGLWDPTIGGLAAVLTRAWTLGTLSISLGDVLAFALVIWLAVKISQLMRFVLEEDVFPLLELPRGAAPAISMLAHYSVLTVGFFLAVGAAGLELDRLAFMLGALGVGIGFGLQNLVNNFVSGLILILERPIKIGDTVEVGSLIGQVLRIGIRSSTVRTLDGAEVIVPNGNLISSEVVNWTLSDRLRRIEITVGVKYGSDPNTVLDLLRAVAREHDGTLDDPEPEALFLEFGDSSLDFCLRVWTSQFESWRTIKSELTVGVNTALNEAGIEIPFPQRDLHLRSVAEAATLSVKPPQE